MNYARAGKIIIGVGIAIMIAFIVVLIVSARRQNAGQEPLLPSSFPNPFAAGTPAQRPPVSNPGQVINQPGQSQGIIVKPEDPLLQLTTFPVTGYAVMKNSDGTHFVRTNVRDLGYIYDIVGVDNPQIVQQTTTLIQDAGQIAFGAGGEVYARYYDKQNFKYESFFGLLEDSLSKVTCTTQFPVKVALGQTGQPIEQLQFYLTDFLKSESVVVPGTFDAATKQMLIDFQKAQKLTPDGSIGPKTLAALNQICTQKEKETRAAQMVANKTPRFTLSGRPQTGEVQTVVTSDDGSKLFYTKTTIAGIRGYSRSLIPVGVDNEIYRLSFAEWVAQWIGNTAISLTTKPAASVNGFAYTLDAATGAMTKVLDGIPGLTTLFSGVGNQIIIGRSVNNSYSLELVTTSATAAPVIEKLSLATFPEKCTFTRDGLRVLCMVPESVPEGVYPDQWYQSLVSFTDSLWEIGLAPLRKRQVDTFSNDDTPRTFDAVSLRTSPDDNYLFFIDQNTGYLWRYNLSLRR